jgi:hypothetical protein
VRVTRLLPKPSESFLERIVPLPACYLEFARHPRPHGNTVTAPKSTKHFLPRAEKPGVVAGAFPDLYTAAQIGRQSPALSVDLGHPGRSPLSARLPQHREKGWRVINLDCSEQLKPV